MPSKYIDFETRTSVHITLTRGSHAALRTELFSRSLSMQRVFREVTDLIADGDPYMVKLLDRLETEKREKRAKQFSDGDAESIYKIIEEETK